MLWCVYEACGQEFTTADSHYYHEETDVCYCSEGCYEAEAQAEAEVEAQAEAQAEAMEVCAVKTSDVYYSKQQVESMTDDELLSAFTDVTGKTSLPCKHCHYGHVELGRFVLSIRKRCYKRSTNGLHSKIKIPKTCDHQIINNDKRGGFYRAIQKAGAADQIETIKAQLKETFTERRVHIIRI